MILGFHERKVKQSVDQSRPPETRYIVPRAAQTAESTARADQATRDDDDDDYRNILFVPSSCPISHPAVSLERHLRRAQSEDTLPKQWRQAMASYEDSNSRNPSVIDTAFDEQPADSTRDDPQVENLADEASVISNRDEAGTQQSRSLRVESDSEPLSSTVFALTESLVNLPLISAPVPSNYLSDASESGSYTTRISERTPDDNEECSGVDHVRTASSAGRRVRDAAAAVLSTVLPPLVALQLHRQASLATDSRPRSSSSALNNSNDTPSPANFPTVPRTLSRSESAPTTIAPLEPYVIPQHQKPKRYRGLAAALDDDTTPEFHVGRDRGASIFRKDCESTEANGPNRIRISKTLAAQSHVMAVRVQHALGKRDHNRYGSPLASSLLRPDRHTFEQAHAAMTAAAKARETGVHRLGFCRSVQLLTE